MILSDHNIMHPKPSFTLFSKQLYDLEMDSKFVACFLPTCSSPEKPYGRIHRAISLKYSVYRLKRRRTQIYMQ